MGSFPSMRPRRLRGMPMLREMVQETRLSTRDFVYPVFVTHGRNVQLEIEPMPGTYQLSLDRLLMEIATIVDLGIPAVLLFGIPSSKDAEGSEAYDPNGIIQEAIRVIKQAAPHLLVITDVCLCDYTVHGHCGVVNNDAVDNDRSLELLARVALCQAEAGSDIVAPSAMMDGQVTALRSALDDAGFIDIPIMSYSAKYGSAFYDPFRVAAGSTPGFGDRRGYQIDPPNSNEALREIEMDIAEGADIVMVKPALAYLDIITRAKQVFSTPVAAYNVSGEYAMVKAAAQNKWLQGDRVTIEILTAIKRAGADLIISYHSKEIAEWLL